MERKPFLQRKSVWLVAAACVLAVAAILFFRPKRDDSLNVPLGVEQAAIVTYSGPPVAVTPYKWGVAVNVRIAKATGEAGSRIYDVRYIVNREGTFDLKDYLTGEDGSPLEGLPSFKFQGDPKLSKQLDARIQETEEITVDVGGHYNATLAALGAFWFGWLLLLIFWGRAKPAPAAAPAPPEPTVTEKLRAFLVQLDSGTLDATGKARLEMLLLRHWREQAALADAPMSAALEAIGRSEKTGEPLRQLQQWLHHPASSVRRQDIAGVIARYIAESAKREEEARA